MAIRGNIIEHYHLFFRRILYFWLVSLPYYVDAQISPAQVKAPLIIHFCENVTWNNAIKPPLVIGIYAETDDIFELLSGAKDKHTIQEYPYIVKKITDLTDISGCQALYYSTQDNNNLYALYKQAQQNNILLISDNAEDQLFIMINFVQVKDRLSFKVNMPNLSVSGFTITPNLLLNGGSVVDIKDAYQKFEQRLRDNQNKMELSLRMLNEKESQLSDKESVIRDKDLLIQQKEADILRFKNDIRQTEITARLLKEHVAQTNKVLDVKVSELEIKDKHLRSIFADIATKQNELNKLQSGIKTLKKESSQLKIEVVQKNEVLSQKEAFIQAQRNKLLISLGLIASLIFTAFALSRLFFIKKKHSHELEEKVRLRTSELQAKTEDYISVLNLAPVPIWEIDFSKTKKTIDSKQFSSADELHQYLLQNPAFMLECYAQIEVTQINKATFDLFQVANVEEFNSLATRFRLFAVNESITNEMIILYNNEYSGSVETLRIDSAGKRLNVIINWIDISDTAQAFSRVLISIIDITRIRKIEQELLQYQEHLELMVLERTNEIDTLNEELNTQNEELYTINEALEISNKDLKDAIEELNVQKEALNTALMSLKDAQMQMVQSEKMASLGILTAGVAHEINNPLNFIQTGIYALEESLKEPDSADKITDFKEILQHMNVGVQRASAIVKSLNTFSRKDTNLIRKCDIHHIIDNTLLILNHEIKDKCTIVKKYFTDELFISGNEENIHQVFLNVINNSVQAMNSSGCITIETHIESNKAVIIISDNGEGISQENIKRIFDPFFTTKEPGRGIGLGLSIVFKIIEEHKGTIQYTSEQGIGTSVTIIFPLA